MKNLHQKFSDQPIGRKLSFVVLLTAGLLIFVMILSVAIEKKLSYQKILVNSSRVLGKVIADNTTAALIYRDSGTAREMLGALAAEDAIIMAALYNGDGTLFASFHSTTQIEKGSGSLLPPMLNTDINPENTAFGRGEYFDTLQEIKLDNKVIGHILLRTSLQELHRQMRLFLALIVLFSIVLLAGAMFLCLRLNRTILAPIADFAGTILDVTQTQNYRIRVDKFHNDEIGILADGFNVMLGQIDKRDQELESHRHHLEDMVELRTMELREANQKLIKEIREREEIQNKLAHAEKMEAIGTLAGGVAHDLNNILSGIVSYPDLLLMNLPGDSKLRSPLETIRSSGKRAAAIVQDLLTLSRRGVTTKEQFDLQQLVDEYLKSPELEELKRRHGNVEIRFENNSSSFLMTGSKLHLNNTVMNLVTNAIEAMPGGGVVDIGLQTVILEEKPTGFEKWRQGNYHQLSVKDSGIGIEPKDINRIFEPFYSRKEMGKSGTGLGMSVVWGTVEDHQGSISVTSKVGEGTTFRLLFPGDLEALPQQQEQQEVLLSGSGETVLIVDDEKEQRLIATNILEELGYSVDSVDSGEAAIEYLQQKSADMLLLDMLMAPGIDGLETYKKIVKIYPSQKAVIASGYSQVEKIEEARSLGVIADLKKPYSVSEIAKVFHQALQEN